MDLALIYDAKLQAFDLAIDGSDLRAEGSLASAVMVSLMSDRLAESYEVTPGEDRRGWWADAFAGNQHKTGSRLWLLQREKQLQGTVQRCRQYCEEALQWLIDDGLATTVGVTVFIPRTGWIAALIKVHLDDGARGFRFEFDEARQIWRLAGEGA